ncbi:MAG: metallophosphoesterase family protein [Candidatus Thorarchaeota archaeon]
MSRRLPFLAIFSLLVISVVGVPLARWDTAATDNQLENQVVDADEVFPRGPTVHMVNKTAAMIYWKTDTQTTATVNYGNASDNLDSSVENSTLAKEHRVWIDGLTADTTVYYEAVSDGTSSEVYHFKTEPEDGEPFKLIIMGDNRPSGSLDPEQPETFKDMMDMVRNEEPHLVIMSGDYVYKLSDTNPSSNAIAWGKFLNVTDKVGHYTPIYGAIGNHDTTSGDHYADGFLDVFQQYGGDSTYFSFDYAGVHFTFIDTEIPGFEGRITGDQYDWLVDDLESTNKMAKYVIGHQPMYPLSHLGSSMDVNITERNRLQDLFEEQNVTLYACGHDHLFDRLTVNGVVHIISGGAGAPVYSTPWGGAYNHYLRVNISYSETAFEAIRMNGAVAENYTLPYEGHIEIALRRIANTTSGRPDESPAIYFSEVPEEVYYSWDGGDNSTELGTLPETNGVHSLDVFAKGSDGVWNHKYYEFTTVGGEETETTTTPPPSGINPLLIAGVIGVAAVIVVIVVYRLKMSTT